MPVRFMLAIVSSCFSVFAWSATFTVDSELDLMDDHPRDGLCSANPPTIPFAVCTLRAAVMEAEADPGLDQIIVPADFDIDLFQIGDGGNEVGSMDITTAIEILGFIDAPPLDWTLLPSIDATIIEQRHFRVSGDLTLRGIQLVGGSSENSGGAVLVQGNGRVRFEFGVLANNRADTRGGAIAASAGQSNQPQIIIQDSLLISNDGGTAGGGAVSVVNGDLTIQRSSLLDSRSQASGSTITIVGHSDALIENTTINGGNIRPVIPGLTALTGIEVFSSSSLDLRNTTISDFDLHALNLFDLDGNERIRVANSVLESDNTACMASGSDLTAADVGIGFSLVQHQLNCDEYYRFGVISGTAELGPLMMDEPPRFTFSRAPLQSLSNIVDSGAANDIVAGGPDYACTNMDQIGNPRPVDANLDEDADCDMGAIERPAPIPFVVNHFVDDLSDDLPGDGLCASADVGFGSVCTLRAAVMEANALPDLQQITFEESLQPVQLTLPDSGMVGGELVITDAVAIEGNLVQGRPVTAILNQMSDERTMTVNAPNFNVYLRNLRWLNGQANAGSGGAVAVLLDSDVRIARSEFDNNSASDRGGAIAVIGGQARISDSDFNNNDAGNNGMAIFANFGAELELANVSLRNHLGLNGGAAKATVVLDQNVRFSSTNTTYSANQLGIAAFSPERMVLAYTTMRDQLSGGVNITLGTSSLFSMFSAIVEAPTSMAPDCTFTGINQALDFGLGGVLDGDASCAMVATQDGLTAEARLLPLSRPVGQISYHYALDTNAESPSPAIDVLDGFLCLLGQDQYGDDRPVDLVQVPDLSGPCDLGAKEAQVFDLLFNDSFESS
ncbi:MAG: hypothetical protein AAGH65_01615 [Pseudomonadota bacterium]